MLKEIINQVIINWLNVYNVVQNGFNNYAYFQISACFLKWMLTSNSLNMKCYKNCWGLSF